MPVGAIWRVKAALDKAMRSLRRRGVRRPSLPCFWRQLSKGLFTIFQFRPGKPGWQGIEFSAERGQGARAVGGA